MFGGWLTRHVGLKLEGLGIQVLRSARCHRLVYRAGLWDIGEVQVKRFGFAIAV